MELESRKKCLKPLLPEEEHEGLHILARIIAKAVIKEALRKHTAQTQLENPPTKNT